MKDLKSWKELLLSEMRIRRETLLDIEVNTLSDEEMEAEFDPDYGGTNGGPFTIWTRKTVYFPLCYDGAEWVGSVARHPDGVPTSHQGGG